MELSRVAIIGSREITGLERRTVGNIAHQLVKNDVQIITGGAGGTDDAAEKGALDYLKYLDNDEEIAGLLQVYLPFSVFNGRKHTGSIYKHYETAEAHALRVLQAEGCRFHGMINNFNGVLPESASDKAKQVFHFMSRNACIIRGIDVISPVDIVICCAPTIRKYRHHLTGEVRVCDVDGGTGHGVRCATSHGIKCYNIREKDDVEVLVDLYGLRI